MTTSVASRIAASRLQRHALPLSSEQPDQGVTRASLSQHGAMKERAVAAQVSPQLHASVLPLANLLLEAPHSSIDPRRADGAHQLSAALSMPSIEFYKSMEDCAAVVTFNDGQAADSLAAALQPLVVAELGEQLPKLKSLCMRLSPKFRSARVAALLQKRCGAGDDGPGREVVLMIAPDSKRAAYEALTTLLREAPTLDVQVYGRAGPRSAPSSASEFKGALDQLIETALQTHCSQSSQTDPRLYRPNGAKDQSAGIGVHVLEVCAGDGSLAAQLLGRSSVPIGSYTCLELDSEQVATANEKLASFSNVTVMQADATERAPYEWRCCFDDVAAHGGFDVVLASGSVLCGQVGSPQDAEAAIASISASLHDGGLLVATGLSPSFLHPELLRRVGLETVVCGSLPAGAAHLAPPPHAFGRFQLFILRKGAVLSPSAATLVGDPIFYALTGGYAADMARQETKQKEAAKGMAKREAAERVAARPF